MACEPWPWVVGKGLCHNGTLCGVILACCVDPLFLLVSTGLWERKRFRCSLWTRLLGKSRKGDFCHVPCRWVVWVYEGTKPGFVCCWVVSRLLTYYESRIVFKIDVCLVILKWTVVFEWCIVGLHLRTDRHRKQVLAKRDCVLGFCYPVEA